MCSRINARKYAKDLVFFIILFISFLHADGQDVSIEGHLKLANLDTVSTEYLILTRESNGIVGVANPYAYQMNINFSLKLHESYQHYAQAFQDVIINRVDDRVYIEGLLRKVSGNVAIGDTLAILAPYYRPRKIMVLFGGQNEESIRINVYLMES